MAGIQKFRTEIGQIAVGDVEIGAVELKDKDTDNRANVIDLSTLFPSLPPGTYGLVVGGIQGVVPVIGNPLVIQTPIDVLANTAYNDVNAVVRSGVVVYTQFLNMVISDNFEPAWSVIFEELVVNSLSIQVINTHSTNGLVFKLRGSVASGEGNPEIDITSEKVLAPQEQAVVHIIDEKWGTIRLYVKREVAGNDSSMVSLIRG